MFIKEQNVSYEGPLLTGPIGIIDNCQATTLNFVFKNFLSICFTYLFKKTIDYRALPLFITCFVVNLGSIISAKTVGIFSLVEN